ncbi:hypothetical protein GcM1_c11059o13 [Golovinomyces cichoracearum]|uniref:Uncharacterized protein n=1 Tax=Golovinomyces cichoracearum TaxID=62708 RepID=A0A420IFD9_9PEZI|nr:hypothetical protein GcM1_c11059o13 [Golovinomyces cichoracearum]
MNYLTRLLTHLFLTVSFSSLSQSYQQHYCDRLGLVGCGSLGLF